MKKNDEQIFTSLSYKIDTVRDPKVSPFKKTLEKCDTLGTFTQKVLLLDYNKTEREKMGHFGVMEYILPKKSCDAEPHNLTEPN